MEENDIVIDQKLEPEFVLNNLLKIYNTNNNIEGSYTGEIAANRMIVINFNYGTSLKECFKLPFPSIDKFGLYRLGGGSVSNCTNTIKSGTSNMTNIIQFIQENNYDYYAGTDFSQLEFNFEDGAKSEVSLLAIKLFTTGNSWYSNLGFITPNIYKQQKNIDIFRNSNFIQLIDSLQIPENKKKEEKNNLKDILKALLMMEFLLETK